jgi:DNA mismatch repair ATPase MutS
VQNGDQSATTGESSDSQNEIVDLANILTLLKGSEGQRSLVVIDEIGGQNGSEGKVSKNFCLMWAICEYLLSLEGCLTMISTHNHLLN